MRPLEPGCLAVFMPTHEPANPAEVGMVVTCIEYVGAPELRESRGTWRIDKPLTWISNLRGKTLDPYCYADCLIRIDGYDADEDEETENKHQVTEGA